MSTMTLTILSTTLLLLLLRSLKVEHDAFFVGFSRTATLKESQFATAAGHLLWRSREPAKTLHSPRSTKTWLHPDYSSTSRGQQHGKTFWYRQKRRWS